MKRLIIFSVFLFSLFSCDNEINIVADYKTIPVVYAFLNPQLDTNFIRIEKAFLDESANALTLAKNPDSLYFDDIEVKLTKGNGISIILDRIDGNTIGRPRDNGVFATSPNWLYYFTNNQMILRSDEHLTLQISHDGNEIASASTTMIGGVNLTSSYSDDFPISFQEGISTGIGFKYSRAAGIYGINLEFNYREEDENGSFQDQQVIWEIEREGVIPKNSNRLTHKIDNGADFYNFLNGAIDNERRKATKDMTIEMVLIGSELRAIRDIEFANQGVTGSQDLPVYTNVHNGRGIFSSRYIYREEGIELNGKSIDSLTDGRITKLLNFIN